MSDIEIPWVDLRPQTDAIRDELRGLWAGVLDSGAFSNGPEVQAFEKDWARYVGVKHALGVSDGTTAIILLLRAAGIEAGDEVLTAPTTYFATAEAIVLAGGTPSFADVDPATGNLDPDRVAAALSPKTRAVVAVHLGGRPAPMDALRDITAHRGVRLFEDAAQAHGATFAGRRAGSLADGASFSFYPTKNLGAFGEGGAVTTNDDVLASRVRSLRDHGQDGRHRHVAIGTNARLHSLQGAVLRLKLAHLDRWNAERRSLARIYVERLSELPLGLPDVSEEGGHVFHLFSVRTSRRDALAAHLASAGIGTGSHYPTPVHLQPAFSHLGLPCGSFPNAERYASEQLSLPLFPGMVPALVDRVCAEVRRFFSRSSNRS